MISMAALLSVGVIIHASPAPSLGTCRCDWNTDHILNSQDFFDFLTDFFAGAGDYNEDGLNNSQDFFDFLACFFSGCPDAQPSFAGNPNPNDPGEQEFALPGRSACNAGMPSIAAESRQWINGVYLFSGESYQVEVDMRIPGRGFDFVWARTYRSQQGIESALGHRWDFSYNIFVVPAGPDLDLSNGHGRRDRYSLQPDGSWTNPAFFRQIVRNPDGTFVVHLPDASRWNLHALDGSPAAGKIASVADRNSNTMTFQYSPAGNLSAITDTLDRTTLLIWDGPWIGEVRDFTGRTVRYDYYDGAEPGGNPGDLKSATTPAVTGTPNGNDFPDGKTTLYTYTTGQPREELNHLLLTVTDPRGHTYLTNEYAATTDTTDLNFARVVRQVWGDALDDTTLAYVRQTPGAGNNFAVIKTILRDRVGNVKECFFDDQNRGVICRELTGRADPDVATTETANRPGSPLRPGDPPVFETRWTYNANSLVTSVLLPNQNSTFLTYDSANPDQLARGNLIRRRRLPGPIGADQPEIVESWEYLSGFGGCGCGGNFVVRHVDARGSITTHTYDAQGNRLQTIDRIPSIVRTFAYNPFGQMTSSLTSENGDPDGYRVQYDYFSSGPQNGYLRARIVDPGAGNLNLTTQYEYDPVGNITAVISPRGNRADYIRNALNQVVRTISPQIMTPSGPVRYQTDTYYDANDNLVRTDVQNIDDLGAVLSNIHFTTITEYEILNRPVRICREKGSFAVPPGQLTCAGLPPVHFITTEFAYDSNRNRTLVRLGEAVSGTQPANTASYVYDERDLLFRETRALGDPAQSTTQHDYDPNGNRVRLAQGTEDASAPRITVYTIDGYDRVARMDDPMGNATIRHFDPSGNITLERMEGELIDLPGAAGNVRLTEESSTFDAMHRLIARSRAHFNTHTQAPLGDGQSTTTWEYDVHSKVVRSTNDNNHSTLFEYDAARRTSRVIDARLNTAAYAYDEDSNVTSTTETDKSDTGNPDQVFTTTHAYDALNRKISSTDNAGNTNRWFYDSRSNAVRTLDPLTHETRFIYDGVNRLTRTIRDMDADGAAPMAMPGDADPDIVTSQSWDNSSRLTSRTDDNANTTEYIYDPLGRRTAEVFADCTQSTQTFDVHGNALLMLDANGTVVACQYDLRNRPIHKNITPGPGVDPDTTFETYRYEARSLTVHAQDDDSVVTAVYDSLGMKDCETLNGEETRCVFDNAGNLLSYTAPGGRVTNISYDDLERPDVFSEPGQGGGLIADYSYVGRNRVERRDYGNGTRLAITYDGITGVPNPPGDFGVRRIVTTRHSVIATNANIDLRTYTWSRDGNKTARRDMRPMGPQYRHIYSYDAADRLIRTQVLNPSNQTLRDENYMLDGVHNRETVTGGLDPGNYTMLGDACAPPADQDVNQYTSTPFDAREYDNNGNLTAISPGQPTQRLMRYDYRNRMVQHEDAHTGVVSRYGYDALGRRIERIVDATGTPQVTRYFYRNHQVIEERDGANATTATYVYGLYIDEPLTMRRAGMDYYYHTDDNFNVMALTNGTGMVVERYEYGDYGQPLNPQTLAPVMGHPSTVGNPYSFSGRCVDSETGYYWHRSRYMEPAAGRFTTRDSAGMWHDVEAMGNAMSCFGSNPYSRLDPYGRAAAALVPIVSGTAIIAVGVYSLKLWACANKVQAAYDNCIQDNRDPDCCERNRAAGMEACKGFDTGPAPNAYSAACPENTDPGPWRPGAPYNPPEPGGGGGGGGGDGGEEDECPFGTVTVSTDYMWTDLDGVTWECTTSQAYFCNGTRDASNECACETSGEAETVCTEEYGITIVDDVWF